MILSICSEPKVLEIMRIVNILITIIQIIAPIVLIFTLIFKFVKSTINDDQDSLQKVLKTVPSNIIASVLIVLIPFFVSMVVKISFPNSDYKNCLTVKTIEQLNEAYENKMVVLIDNVRETLSISDYNNALNYLKNIKDKEKKEEFSKELDEIYEKVKEKNRIKIVSIDVVDTVVNIKVDGNTNVAGYYFSSIEKTPDLDGYDWIDTNETEFKTVKIPGTYYVYVKDDNGYITEAQKVEVPEVFEIIYLHQGKRMMPMSISTYLSRNNSSIDELNMKIAYYNKKHILRTRESVVVGAMAFINEVQSWGYYLPYSGSNEYISKDRWGVHKYWGGGEKTFLACNPFVVWSFKNAGLNIYGNWDEIRRNITRTVRITARGLTEYELLVNPETYDKPVHIYRYFVGALGSTSTYGDNIIPRNKGRSGDILQSFSNSGHEMLIVDKYDDDYDGVSDGYVVLQSRDIGHCYEKVPYTTSSDGVVVYDMTNVYNNTANFAQYLNGWNQYYIPESDYPSYLQ